MDVPSFHFPTDDRLRYNDQPDFETKFPRLAAWAECITKRRDASATATCFVKKFRLTEVSISGSESRSIATFDFSRRGQVECGFTNDDPPVRTKTFCAGANYRRERDGQLCWYSWCVSGQKPSDEGMVPMTNGQIGADSILSINAATEPKFVSHWWTQSGEEVPHPRSRTSQGYRYYIEVEIYTVGDAVFRIGADRYIETEGGRRFPCTRLEGNAESEGCERFFSNWFRSVTGDVTYKSLRFRISG